MKIYVQEKLAYVPLGGGNLLCIGSEEEVTNANPIKVVEMIAEALAVCQYHAINSSKGFTKH